MTNKSRKSNSDKPSTDRLDAVVEDARKARESREKDYRARSLKLNPWVCGKCGREFTRENLHELTVHHIDHNHDNNPPDGSNWENLCLFCHDNEHSRHIDHQAGGANTGGQGAGENTRHNPFGDLRKMMVNEPDTDAD